VELFEAIRREYQFGVGTIKGVARKLGIHRRMVREALADAVPKERKSVERVRPKLEPAIPFIDTILETDLNARRANNGTRRAASLTGCGLRNRQSRWRRRPCARTCGKRN
jgi:hypothetical protein